MHRYSICLLLFVCSTGCTQKLPPDWEKVYPCTITVTKDGAGLEAAVVALSRTEKPGSWAVTGITDSQGVAMIHTSSVNFAQSGAPAGTFKVTVVKDLPRIPDPTPQEVIDKMGHDEQVAHYAKLDREAAKRPPIIPLKYAVPEETPLTITVGPAAPAAATFEVGRANAGGNR